MTAAENEIPQEASAAQPIKGWVVLAAPLLGAVLFIVFAVVAVAAFAISKGALDQGSIRDFLGRSPYGYFIALGASDLFYLCLLFAMWLLLPKRGAASLGSYFPQVSKRTLLAGLGGGVLMALLVGPALYLASQVFHIDLQPTPGETMLVPKTSAQLVAVLIAGAVIAPVVEEAYFRGLLLRWLRKWIWVLLAVIIDAVFFAIVHGRFVTHAGLGGIIVTAALLIPGVVLALFAIRTKSLWPGVVAHGFYNGILLSLSYVAPDVN